MTPTILIIDDDPAIGASLKLVLRRSGFQPEAVTRPMEALPAIERLQPALVLLDMNYTVDTSGRQGMKLLREIRAFLRA